MEVNDPDIVEDADEASIAGMDPLAEIEAAQAVNEMLTNTPTELEINGKKIHICSKPLQQVVIIDRAIVEMQRASQASIIDDEEAALLSVDEMYERVNERQDRAWAKFAELIVLVGGGTDDSSKITVEDVMQISVPDLNQIVIEYVKRNNVGPLLKNVQAMRSF